MRRLICTFMAIGSFLLMEEILYSAPEAVEKTVVSTYDGSPQPYMLFVPEEAQTKEVPLLVVLHGWGGNQRSWIDYTPVVSKAKEHGFAVAAPHGRGNFFYRQPGEQDVLDTIDAVCKENKIDRTRIALAGHSMGGWGTSYIGMRNADLFCTIIPMSGWAPQELFQNALNLHPFFIHDRDDDVVPVTNSRTAAQGLVQRGQDVYYKEEIGYGHASQMIGDNMDAIMDWVQVHPRRADARRVSVATRTPSTHRGERWLKVLASAQFPKLATVESELTTDSAKLKIKTSNTARFSVDWHQLNDVKTVECNGQAFPVEKRDSWGVFEMKDGGWHMSYAASLPQATPIPVQIPASLAAIETTGSSTQLTDAVAEILRGRLKCDVLLLADDQFMIPPGGLKRTEQLLDLAVRPDTRLVRAKVSGRVINELQKYATMPFIAPHIYPPNKTIKDNESYNVIVPINVVKILGKSPYEVIDHEIGDYLVVEK